MIPVNVLNGDKLGWSRKTCEENITLLPAAKPWIIKGSNSISVKQSMLHLLTIRNLRSAHIFKFRENETEWKSYHPEQDSLPENELRGLIAFSIRQVQTEKTSLVAQTSVNADRFIIDTKKPMRALEEIEEGEKVFIVLSFKNCTFVTGNYYEEDILCQALLNYQPSPSHNVISKLEGETSHVFPSFLSEEDLSKPSVVRVK